MGLDVDVISKTIFFSWETHFIHNKFRSKSKNQERDGPCFFRHHVFPSNIDLKIGLVKNDPTQYSTNSSRKWWPEDPC
jgi:hypothetical protein